MHELDKTLGATRTWTEMFPKLRAVVLQDGHVDPITGPRCIVKMSEGPLIGRYVIAHTKEVLAGGTDVLVDYRSRATKAEESSRA